MLALVLAPTRRPFWRPLSVGLTACLLALLAPASAAQAQLVWSGPFTLDLHAAGIPMSAIACPTSGQCTAVDLHGQEITFNPQAPAGAIATPISGAQLTGVACPAATQCTAVDHSGEEVTFNPQSPAGAPPVALDPVAGFTSVACPSVTLCAGVDAAGEELTFNPQAPPSSPSTSFIDPGKTFVGVACPDSSQCVAVDSNGSEIPFAPGPPASTQTQPMPTGLTSPTALACLSTTRCAAVDSVGRAGTFSLAGNSISTAPVDSGTTALSAVTCYGPGASGSGSCTAVDVNGNEVTFDVAASGAVGTPQPAPVDPGSLLTAVSCPASTQCTAVDIRGQEVTFDPGSAGAASPVAIDGGTEFTGLACPSTAQCTAIDLTGTEDTFDPGTSGAPAESVVDSSASGDYAIVCPSDSQCTAVDGGGEETTFDPQSPGSPAPTPIDGGHALLAVGCPSTVQCTAVDDRGFQVTFDPQSPGSAAPLPIEGGYGLPAVACPTTLQCTAVDDRGAEITFDPRSPSAATAATIDSGPVVSIACPVQTQCTAVDAAGQQVTFDPQQPADASLESIDGGHQLNAIACRTPTDCVAVDTAGRALEGDPNGTGPWSASPLTSGALSGVACPSPVNCVAVDARGEWFVASSGPLPPVPAKIARPTIKGVVKQGRRVSERHGRWSGAPTSYRYRWERCNPAGRRCVAIRGATAQTYTLARADVGHRIRVEEWAANVTGAGAGAVSAATKLVRPLVAVSVSRVSLTGLSRARPKLAFTLTAGPREPSLRSVAVVLPSILHPSSGGRRAPAKRIVVSARGRSRAFAVRVHGETLTVVLARSSRTVRVTIAGRAISESRAVARRVRSHRLRRLRIVLVVGAVGGSRTRLVLPFRVL